MDLGNLRSQRRVLAGVSLAGLVLTARLAGATPLGSGFDLERFTQTPALDRFAFVPEPIAQNQACDEALCSGAVTARFIYEHHAVDATVPLTDVMSTTSSASTLRTHVGVAWAPVKILQWSLDIPISLYQTNLMIPPADETISPQNTTRVGKNPSAGNIGDVRFAGRVVATCEAAKLKTGLQLSVTAPTGDHEHLMGDESPRVGATALFEWGEHDDSLVVVNAAAGIGLRHHVTFGDQQLGNSANGGLAVGAHLCDPMKCKLGKLLELQVEWMFDGGVGSTTPAAFMGALGGHVAFGADPRAREASNFWITALLLKGFGDAVGVPGWGATLGVSWAPRSVRHVDPEN